jgi:hypothetical protein
LRSPELRHAYDVRLAEARLASAAAPLDPGTVRHWEHQEDAPRHGQRSRWLLAVALVSCVVLAVLIVRNPDKSAPWDPDADFHANADQHDPGPAIEDRDLGVLSAALAVAPAPEAPTNPATTSPDAPAALPPPIEAPVPAPAPAPAAASVAASAAPAKLVATAFRPAPRRADPAARADPTANVVSRVSTVPAEPAPRKSVAAAPAPAPTAAAIAPPRPAPAAPAPAAPAPAPSRVAVAAASEDPAVMFNRMRLAEQRVAQVAAYLAAKPGAAPMWNDPQTEAQAARLRTQLNARKGTKLELARPAWRLQPDNASLSADYRCRSAGSEPCQGRLDVELVWREGLWLVRDVGLGPSA